MLLTLSFFTNLDEIHIKALLQMKTQNPYHFLISFCTVGRKFDFFRFFIKMLITLSFIFPIWIKKTYEGPSSDEETKLVLILKISYAQWIFLFFPTKMPSISFLLIWIKIHMQAHLEMENQNLY